MSRVNPKDSQKHAILATGTYKARELASQMNLNLSNGWGIVRTIIDVCSKQADGTYLLIKDRESFLSRVHRTFINMHSKQADCAVVSLACRFGRGINCYPRFHLTPEKLMLYDVLFSIIYDFIPSHFPCQIYDWQIFVNCLLYVLRVCLTPCPFQTFSEDDVPCLFPFLGRLMFLCAGA